MKGQLACILAVAMACGGGSHGTPQPTAPPAPSPTPTPTPTPAPASLSYQDPSSGAYRFVCNATLSTGQHLVLDLVGPAQISSRGVAFTLTTDASQVAFAKVATADAALIQNRLYDLGTGTSLQVASASGGVLKAGLFQKGQGNAKLHTQALCRVALDLTATAPSRGSILTLSIAEALVLPETGGPQVIAPTVGVLSVQ